jgi:hypothetical protein
MTVTSYKGRNHFRSFFKPPHLRKGKRRRIRLNGGRVGNRGRTIEWQSWILFVTAYKGQIDIRSFYEVGQSLTIGRSSDRCIYATVRDGRYVSTENLLKVECSLSNAGFGSDP